MLYSKREVNDVRTLLLNATYEPLCTVSWKRAMNLVLQGDAEVVHEYEETLKSEKLSVPYPSVIRLLKYRKVPRRRYAAVNRGSILARDGHECQFTHCNDRGTTMDHVIPRSKGGPHTWENVVAACRKCNFKKADRSLKEMGWKLKRQPKQPDGRFMPINQNVHPDWEKYLNW